MLGPGGLWEKEGPSAKARFVSAITAKLSARWQVTDFLALRGSVGDTFRGPLPADLGTAGVSAVAGIDVLGGAYKATDTVGNPALAPETALTYNIGAIVEFGGFNFSVDYWTYEFEGRFTTLPVQAIAENVVKKKSLRGGLNLFGDSDENVGELDARQQKMRQVPRHMSEMSVEFDDHGY